MDTNKPAQRHRTERQASTVRHGSVGEDPHAVEALLKHASLEVQLLDLGADAGAIRKRIAFFGAKAALHAKVVVFDRKDVFVGSFNLDPRSADINTEAGLYMESPELAAQVVAWMDEGVRPENSYRVLLDEDGGLQWLTEYEGRAVRFDTDPGSTAWQRFVAGFIGILPVEDQL